MSAMLHELRFMDFGFQLYAGMVQEAVDDIAAIAKARLLHATANGTGQSACSRDAPCSYRDTHCCRRLTGDIDTSGDLWNFFE